MATYELVKAKAQAAKQAAAKLAVTSTAVKNAALLAMAAALEAQQSEILAANERDMTAAAAKGMKSSMLDRLKLTAERISGMADGLRQVAGLADPVGNVIDGKTLPNGLHITKIRVPWRYRYYLRGTSQRYGGCRRPVPEVRQCCYP